MATINHAAPGAIRKIRDQKDGLSFREAHALAGTLGSRLARSSEFDRFFSEVPAAGPLTLSNNSWTETIVAYQHPRVPFGESLEWADAQGGIRCHLDTCGFRGQRGIALVFEGCEIAMDGGTMVFVPTGPVSPLERFPKECGFYAAHPLLGLPYDDGKDHLPGHPGTVHLTRDNNGPWVGPVVRSYSRIRVPDNMDHDIYVAFRPSVRLGVFIAEKS
jgi:hypothetical protein